MVKKTKTTTTKKYTLKELVKMLNKTLKGRSRTKLKLRYIGAGGYKDAYLVTLTNNSKVVVKVNRIGLSIKREVSQWNKVKKSEDAKILAHSIKYNWCIQEFIPFMGYNYNIVTNYKTFYSVLAKWNIGDTHQNNVGWRKDKTPVIFDYASDNRNSIPEDDDEYESDDDSDNYTEDDD